MILSRVLVLLSLFAAPALAVRATPLDEAGDAVNHGQFAHADDILTPLVARGHAPPAAYYYLSIVRLAQKQTEEALKLAEHALKAEPDKIEYYDQYSLACTSRMADTGPLEGNSIAIKLRKALEKSLTLSPRHMPTLLALVRFYEHAPAVVGGSHKKAIEYAERIRTIDVYQGEIELGRLSAGENEFESAFQHYDAATKLHPNDLATATACGWTLLKLGRKDEARARFEAVLHNSPDFEPARLGLSAAAPAAN